jgi:CubicO group peptidase (beta-lactamase class C family)
MIYAAGLKKFSPAGIRGRKLRRPDLEALEDRLLLATSPFGTQFQQQFQSLMTDYDIPQGSVALIQNGQSFTYGATSSTYSFTGAAPAAPVADSLFRLASISKTFTAMAILKLAQDGQLSLTDSALGDLGYYPGETISGRNPVTGDSVSVPLNDPQLFQITVEDLLQMTSGFQYNIPLASAAFPNEASGDLTTTVAGSYVALSFAPAPPNGAAYTSPATMRQLVNYAIFEIDENPGLIVTAPGTSFFYDNLNYGILGMIVAARSGSSSTDPATQYMDYLENNILQPLGISVAGEGAPTAAMVGLAGTLEQDAYPTEVQYYSAASPGFSIFPDPDQTLPNDLPEPPAQKVALPYGAATYLAGDFGTHGLVATPTALAMVMNNLSEVYAGAATGPLSQSTVDMMVEMPVNPATGSLPGDDVNFGTGWFGMGLGVTSEGNSVAAWNKNGDLPGTTTLFQRNPDGTVWAATFNGGISGNSHDAFVASLQQIISDALYVAPTANSASVSTQTNVPLAIDVLADDSDPNPDGSLNPGSVTIVKGFGPDHGTVALDSKTGVVTYVPSPGYAGTDSFSYIVSDDFGLASNPATVTIQVVPPAQAIPIPSGAHVAYGDVLGDGTVDTIVGAAEGTAPWVTVYDGDADTVITRFLAYRKNYHGGVFVAAADLNGSGRDDILTWPRSMHGKTQVRAFNGLTGARIRRPLAAFQLPGQSLSRKAVSKVISALDGVIAVMRFGGTV